jgi:hypothetical protein
VTRSFHGTLTDQEIGRPANRGNPARKTVSFAGDA